MLQSGNDSEQDEKKLKRVISQNRSLQVVKPALVLNIIGAFCALLGLAELIRLITSYWATYGLLANFPLEISIYTIGIAWIFVAFLNLMPLDTHFLEAFTRRWRN